MRGDEIRCVLSRRQLTVFMVVAVFLGAAYNLRSEKVTLSTYYPAPSGIYQRMITTDNTLLARDGGSVAIGRAGSTTNVLTLNGGVEVGWASDASCQADTAGSLRWNGTDGRIEACNGTNWAGPAPLAPNGFVAHEQTHSSYSPVAANLNCASGEVLMSGGCSLIGMNLTHGSFIYPTLLASAPNGNGWRCETTGTNPYPTSVKISARCYHP